jgi:hypothetical protein
MKEESSSPFEQVKSGFWKGIGASIATGLVLGVWQLLQYTKIIPGAVVRWIEGLIPKEIEAQIISRDLWHFGLGVLVFSFLYVVWRENKYVSHMYVKRDALEAGKIKASDLTKEEFHFIFVHWPDLFPPLK